ncbi:hypothetical protein NFJ02_19g33170 [Pycnococcus provasolii]
MIVRGWNGRRFLMWAEAAPPDIRPAIREGAEYAWFGVPGPDGEFAQSRPARAAPSVAEHLEGLRPALRFWSAAGISREASIETMVGEAMAAFSKAQRKLVVATPSTFTLP